MPPQLHIRYERCTGCRSCQLACAIKKSGQFWPETARIRVIQAGPGPLDIPVFCHQCSDHPCVEACPSSAKALTVNEDGVVTVDKNNCLRAQGINCQRCFKACPGGSVLYHPIENVPMFCDRCDGTPACIQSCGSGALALTQNESFDGKHYAIPVNKIADELCLRIYGRRDAD